MNDTNGWKRVEALRYDVRGPNGTVLLKAGTRDVDILFRGGSFTYVGPDGVRVRANKYRDSAGRIYYGY